MRNLKKFLALVLAMVMAFSLMLTVNAANPVKDFDDAGSITEEFVEAADVLTGMKVYQGDAEANTFRPADTITRAEVAALIYRLATGDVDNTRAGTYANYGNFADVAESDWFAGYVGYCANAGYIKGHNGYFNPYDSVTGYEALAMILRAVGYDKNHEFEGATWETNVSALATQLGILTNIKTTHYGNTLYLASRRDVVAELLFQAVSKPPMVVYTPAFGYQPYGMTTGNSGTGSLIGGGTQTTNPTLGKHIFGLTLKEDGIVLGNQETGEKATVMGYAGSSNMARNLATGVGAFEVNPVSYNAYTYADEYNVPVVRTSDNMASNSTVALGNNVKYNLSTGIDVVGHEMHIWYDDRTNDATTGYPVYAYFDDSTLSEVVKVSGAATNLLTMNATSDTVGSTNLYDAMKAAGFTVGSNTSAYLNNSYGRFSLDKSSSVAGNLYTDGDNFATSTPGAVVATQASPEYLYMVVSNNSNKTPDAVIALNLQTSAISGMDNVNTIKTVTVPFDYKTITAGNTYWEFIEEDNILTQDAQNAGQNNGNSGYGGTLEQAQLVGDSAKTLGQKEIGLHITGTSAQVALYNVAGEVEGKRTAGHGTAYTPARTAAGTVGGYGTAFDRDYFKLTPVTDTKDGVVVAYNNNSVTLSDGTVLEKSIVYDTVVANSAVPQVGLDSYGNDLYEHTNYRFYLTEGGKYIGAERMYGNEFVYGTYVDYSQELNSSAFKYYLTGVNLKGEVTTVPVTSLAWSNNQRPVAIGTTSRLGVPYRDGGNNTNTTQGIGMGLYRGFSTGSEVANWTFAGLNDIGVVAGANGSAKNATTPPVTLAAAVEANTDAAPMNNTGLPAVVFDGTDDTATGENFGTSDKDAVIINGTAVTLGAAFAGYVDVNGRATATDEDLLYFTENTKFILVSGYGTDSLKAEVYDGITELRGDSGTVTIDFTATAAANDMDLTHIMQTATAAEMTYFTQSPFIYAQNQVLSRQADVIVLPAAAVTRTGTATIRYVGNATPTMTNSNAVLGREATRFTMYNNGVAEQVWVQGLVDFTGTPHTAVSDTGTRNSATLVAYGNASGISAASPRYHDHFWNLIDTGLTANDGEPIYRVTPVVGVTGAADYPDRLPLQAQNTYVASTYSAQTGSFTTNATITGTTAGTRMLNVATANITNLNKDNPAPTWPGITDLQTLNEAGSLGLYGTTPQYGGTTNLKVSFLTAGTTGANALTVTQIYVCYQQ